MKRILAEKSFYFLRRLGALALLATFVAMSLGAAATAASLDGVRFGAWETDKTRLVLDIDGSVDYVISGDEQGFGRLVIDLKDVSSKKVEQKGEGHVARYSIAPAADGGARVVIEFGRTARLASHFVLEPKGQVAHSRLVIDLATADKAAFLASLPRRYEDLAAVIEAATAPTPTIAPAPAAAPAPKPRPIVIVIDPGHGGNDPGALGPDGTREKDVTLAAAQKLAELLEAKGRYQVVLTRSRDTRLSLEERASLARKAGADLFMSLHADAHGDPSLRGGSVYTLSEKGSERSAREARTQGDFFVNGVNIKQQHSPEVGGILFALAQRETNNASSHFADMLIESLTGVTPLVNNSHRTADLFVLLAPDVPAVLLELGFISNKADEANLVSPAWRDKTMAAVSQSIDRYFDTYQLRRQASNGARGAP